MTIKIGCAVWTFTEPAHNPPYEEAIQTVGELGFDGTELILRDFEDVEGYWTKSKIQEIKGLLASYQLNVSQFAMFQNIMAGLASLDPAEKRRSIETFKIGCGIAAELGTDLVNFVSPWPWTITSPNSYLPEYYYINVPGVDPRLRSLDKFQTKLKVNLPKPFDAKAYWDNHMDSIAQVTAITKSHGMKLAVENHANTMTPHTDSVLRMIDTVKADNLGANLDSVWAYVQREYIPWSIHKYADRLYHVHLRDGDGLASYNLPVGFGNIDWVEVFRALKAIGFDGYVSIEWAHDSRVKENAARTLAYLRELIAEVEAE